MTQPIKRIRHNDDNFEQRVRELRMPPQSAREQTKAQVADIIRRVREGGFESLCEISAQLDGYRPANTEDAFITLCAQTRADITAKADAELLDALQTSAARLREYHERQKPESWQYEDDDGNILGEKASPASRAMIYAPGGKAAYPSSVLMGVVPAKVAGVGEVIVSSPARNGEVSDAVLLAAAAAGADVVCKFGGAQAVAAFALGCAPVPRADVIAGPGNEYVAEAKRQLFGEVGVDSVAGPSEVLIIFDGEANPEWVAADILAQAEHDELAQCIGVTFCEESAAKVTEALAQRLNKTPRKQIAAQSLTQRGAIIIARDIKHCAQIANDFAAEHIQIMCAKAEFAAADITTGGAVFIGENAPVAFGDYCAGTNHVLPTGGSARFFSPLSVRHFMRHASYFQASAAGAKKLAKTSATIARAEGFHAHAESALLRGEQV